MNASRLDAVLPLRPSDCERARLLLRTLEWFFEDLETLWIVTPDDALGEVEAKVSHPRARFLSETEVVPELGFYRTLYATSLILRRCLMGWYVQQLIKMSAASFVGTPFYLTLDADVLCVRPLRTADLVRDGRGVCKRHGLDVHADWYAQAERILSLPRSGFTHGVTPTVLSREGMLALHAYLAGRASPIWRRLGGPLAGWRGFLLRHLPWTEYALYFTFLEAQGLFERYHVPFPGTRLYGHSVWQDGNFEAWQPAELLLGDDAPFFCVVQSSLGIDPRRVWEKIGPFLENRVESRNQQTSHVS